MNQLNKKNVIKYAAIGSYLLGASCLWGNPNGDSPNAEERRDELRIDGSLGAELFNLMREFCNPALMEAAERIGSNSPNAMERWDGKPSGPILAAELFNVSQDLIRGFENSAERGGGEHIGSNRLQKTLTTLLNGTEEFIRDFKNPAEGGDEGRAAKFVPLFDSAREFGENFLSTARAGYERRAANLKEALFNAVRANDITCVGALLDAGANVNVRDGDGYTPLHLAARNGCLDIVQVLIVAGANVNVQDARDEDGYTPLHLAVMGGYLGVVEALLDASANVNAKDRWGNTPLHRAAWGGYLGVVQMLILKGAQVNALDFRVETALDWALESLENATPGERQERQAIVNLLRERGGKMSVEIAAEAGN